MNNLFIGLSTLFKHFNDHDLIPKDTKFDKYCSDHEYINKKNESKNEAVEYVRTQILLKEAKEITESSANKYYFHEMDFHDAWDVEVFAKALFGLLYDRRNNIKSNKAENNKTKFKESDGKDESTVPPLYMAVDFEENCDFAMEFIRIFSIFYGRENDKPTSSCMRGVQIAVCSTHEDTGLKEVNFVLAGDGLSSAYATAKNFVYYSADASLEFVPLCEFFADKDKSGQAEQLFPFDLYLKTGDESWFEAQMLNRLKTDLRKKEYGCKVSGIKVRLGSKIYIDNFYEAELLLHNVGTIKRFAYLIAHDIVKDLEASGDDNEKYLKNLKDGQAYLFLLGYENYSSILMQEVQSLLSEYFSNTDSKGKSNDGNSEKEQNVTKPKIEWLIDTRSEEFPILSFDNYSHSEKKDIKQCAIDEFQGKNKIRCVTILPLGSTMSTIYKLHDSFKRGLRKIIDSKKEPNDTMDSKEVLKSMTKLFPSNYCLVAIGDAYSDSWAKNGDGTRQQKIVTDYLSSVDRRKTKEQYANSEAYEIWHKAYLRSNGRDEQPPTVKFLLNDSAKWDDPYKAGKETDIKKDEDNTIGKQPLLKVDKTSTLLDAHFLTPFRPNVRKYYEPIDGKTYVDGGKYVRSNNIDILKPNCASSDVMGGETGGYVKYSHILRGDNHYQFYFDFEKLARAQKDGMQEWAKKMGELIERDAYNIIISPLQITNSSFLNAVINETFGSNLHLLHINILGTGKENVRTKFDYISQELSKIVQQDGKINFYYVDDSVCTGSGLSRAWKFLLTLCNQSGVSANELFPDGQKFTKVFLFVNRSSYETAQSWVNDPNQDWLGFINICVPSYNTHIENNEITCPGCRIYERYERLRKRCATNELVDYFAKHAKKHLARNPKKYESWMDDQIRNSPSYFEWLREYVWFHRGDKGVNDKIYEAISGFYNSKKYDDGEAKAKWWAKQTISLLIRFNSEIKDAVINKMNYIIALDDYTRLQTMDESYRKLLYDNDMQDEYDKCARGDGIESDFSAYKEKLEKSIVKLLAESLTKKEDGWTQYEAIFKFISYIKVISRDYLAKNYFVREAMYNVLHRLLEIMTVPKGNVMSFLAEEKSEDWKTIIDNIRNKEDAKENKDNIKAALQYRIFKVITHRLALMRAEEMFLNKTIKSVDIACHKMVEDEKNAKDRDDVFLSIPSVQDMNISYIASVKTATMEEDNDAICHMLWDQTAKKRKDKNQPTTTNEGK